MGLLHMARIKNIEIIYYSFLANLAGIAGPPVGGFVPTLVWRANCHSTTRRHVSMKKKTRAGAERSNLSSTIQWSQMADTIRESRMMLATCLIRSRKIQRDKFSVWHSSIFNQSDDGSYYEE